MSILRDKINQRVTYWTPGKPDGTGGFSWGPPQHLDARWQGRQQMIRDRFGQERVSDTQVWVTEDLDVNGRLALGEQTGSNPDNAGGRTIAAKESMVGLDGRIHGYKYFL